MYDEFEGREAFECLEALGEVIGLEECPRVVARLVVAAMAIPLYGCLPERAVHAFNLAVGSGMVGFGQAMLDAVPPTA